MKELTTTLEQRLSGPLPGLSAQLKMAGSRRIAEMDSRQWTVPDTARQAAVMLLLHLDEAQDWKTVLIQRTIHPKDQHSGQVSFPGGSWGPEDETLAHTALRETEEEIGVSPDAIRLLGRLTELYIPVSNFLVHPFVGFLERPPVFQAQPGEVDLIMTPSLRMFYAPENQKITDLSVGSGLTLKAVPHFEVEGRVVWGATAMIISELVALAEPDLFGIKLD